MIRPLIRYLRTLAGLSHHDRFDHGLIRLTSWYPRSTSLTLSGLVQTQMTMLGARTSHNEQPLLINWLLATTGVGLVPGAYRVWASDPRHTDHQLVTATITL